MLIFSLHTFDVPVVGFFWWIGCLQNLSNVKPPVSYAHINTAGIVGEGNIITVRIDRLLPTCGIVTVIETLCHSEIIILVKNRDWQSSLNKKIS